MTVLLNYGEPQILELFKNTLPSKLYWVLFSVNNLRDAVDATNRVLTKEKIDKQLSGQTGAATSYMNVGDVSHSSKKVSFNAYDPIREKLESSTSMVYNMSIHKEENNRPFKPQIYQKRGRDKADGILVTAIEIDHLVGTDKDKTLDPTTGNNCKTDVYNVEMTVVEETIDARIIRSEALEMTIGIEADQEKEI